MDITEVRIKLMEDAGDRLRAFCSVTFDDSFVVRDLKIIEGSSGPFVAMPSRKLTAHCPGCGCKNHLRAAHCNQCGQKLAENQAVRDSEGRAKLYADIAHPINSSCREMIQQHVIEAYQEWLTQTQLPKVLFHASPGAIIKTPELAWCREKLANLHTVDIGDGLHFLQEDNPDLIGAELSKWHAAL